MTKQKTNWEESREGRTKHYKSVFENEQELLKAIINIHLGGKKIELDPMYFKGNLL